jgi:hypothetical protein
MSAFSCSAVSWRNIATLAPTPQDVVRSPLTFLACSRLKIDCIFVTYSIGSDAYLRITQSGVTYESFSLMQNCALCLVSLRPIDSWHHGSNRASIRRWFACSRSRCSGPPRPDSEPAAGLRAERRSKHCRGSIRGSYTRLHRLPPTSPGNNRFSRRGTTSRRKTFFAHEQRNSRSVRIPASTAIGAP